MRRGNIRLPPLLAAASLLSSACYIHTYATPLETYVRRASTCEAAVVVFANAGDLTRPYVALARLSLWYPPDMVATPADERRALRKKAAALGATGLILGHAPNQHQPRGAKSLAIFIAEDSAHASDLCALERQAGRRRPNEALQPTGT